MKDFRHLQLAILLAGTLLYCQLLPAQAPNCNETAAIGAMARATSPAALKAQKQKAGDSYRAQVVFAARMLEIDPKNNSAAEQLLGLIPKEESDAQQSVWLDLTQLLGCPSGGVPDSVLKSMDLLQYHLPRLLARAVLLVPDKMPEYVAYATISSCPDCDYAVQMRKVCLAKHAEFVSAVNKLSPHDKQFFLERVFQPEGCRTLMFPEQ